MVTNYRGGGGQVKFYPYKRGEGATFFSHAEVGWGGGGKNNFEVHVV